LDLDAADNTHARLPSSFHAAVGGEGDVAPDADSHPQPGGGGEDDLFVSCSYHPLPGDEWLQREPAAMPSHDALVRKLKQWEGDFSTEAGLDSSGDPRESRPFDPLLPSSGIDRDDAYCYCCAQAGAQSDQHDRQRIEAFFGFIGSMDIRTLCDMVANYYAWNVSCLLRESSTCLDA
jgi:hypothetical protein